MSIISRFKTLWLGLWSTVAHDSESKHHTIAARGAIEKHKRSLMRIRDALTNLIFQKKKLEQQADAIKNEQTTLKQDIEQAASENRDALALNLMDRFEKLREESKFITEQIATLKQDIVSAREIESQLKKEISQAEQVMGTLSSRFEALKVRRTLQTKILSANETLAQPKALNQPLNDQINKLEAEIETLQLKKGDWEGEWQEMRQKREVSKHREALKNLKERLNGKSIAPTVALGPAR